MGKTNTNSVEYENFDAVSPDVLPEEENEEVKTTEKKNGASRFFAAIFVAISAAVFFLPIGVVVGTEVKTVNLLGLLMDIVNGRTTEKLFGILPVFAATNGFMGKIAAASVYFLVVMLAFAVISGFIAVFSSKKAPGLLRATVLFLTAGTSIHFFTTYLYGVLNNGLPYSLLYLLVVAGIGAITYFVLSIIKLRAKALLNTIQLLLTLEVAVELTYIFTLSNSQFNTALQDAGLSSFSFIIKAAILCVLALDVLIACIRMQTKKGLGLDLIRYLVQLLIAGALSYLLLSTDSLKFALVAAGVSLIQLLVCVIQLVGAKRRKKISATYTGEEFGSTTEEEYVQEEYAQAVPYESCPIVSVETAEEITPTKSVPQVQTAGYDFYNSKSFDPFIASLNDEERNQFTELFILKYKGVMPEIPDYEVGGNNKEFFRKIFIYLGQYRDRIPDGLLAKIYQFAIKI